MGVGVVCSHNIFCVPDVYHIHVYVYVVVTFTILADSRYSKKQLINVFCSFFLFFFCFCFS